MEGSAWTDAGRGGGAKGVARAPLSTRVGGQTVSVFSLGLGRCAPVRPSVRPPVRVRVRLVALSSSPLVPFVHPTALNINFT